MNFHLSLTECLQPPKPLSPFSEGVHHTLCDLSKNATELRCHLIGIHLQSFFEVNHKHLRQRILQQPSTTSCFVSLFGDNPVKSALNTLPSVLCFTSNVNTIRVRRCFGELDKLNIHKDAFSEAVTQNAVRPANAASHFPPLNVSKDCLSGAPSCSIRCTASLRTIDDHLGFRGVIPRSPNHALTALSMTSSLPTCLAGCPATAGVRETTGSVVLCRTCVAPNCCSALTTGSLTPDLSTDSVMRACSDWYVRSTVQNLA